MEVDTVNVDQSGNQFLAISTSSSGANHLITGVSGKRIVVTRFSLFPASAVSIQFADTADSPNLLTGAPTVGTAGWGEAYTPCGLFWTALGKGLDILLGAGVQIDGNLNYFYSD